MAEQKHSGNDIAPEHQTSQAIDPAQPGPDTSPDDMDLYVDEEDVSEESAVDDSEDEDIERGRNKEPKGLDRDPATLQEGGPEEKGKDARR